MINTQTHLKGKVMTKNIEGNKVIFQFNSPIKDEGDISEDFNFHIKAFTCTTGTYSLINLDSVKLTISDVIFDIVKDKYKKDIISEIISTIYDRAKYLRLDYLQKLSINGVDCWCIDNGVDICLLLPSEY